MSGYWRGHLAASLQAETRRAVEYARLHPVPESVWSSTVITQPERPAVGWLTRRARRSNRTFP